MRQLLEKIEENSKFIERERSKISFAISEEKMITAWETSIKTKGTPLLTFYENWSKINRIQKRKKITKNDEIAGELPKIKRPKLSEDAVPVPEHKGPMVLFPSDDEDDENHFNNEADDDSPAPKVKKTKKKKNRVEKKVTKSKPIENDNTIEDKEDIVQDFSVSDW